ncbi:MULTISPECIES: phosphotransferase [unclassified Arthrobacter]|uniref:phosphotransferase n=1 Tax=unclassified Arthrobacter TaxID=235627 RepID=UPI0002E64D92|nr:MULTISPECIES: phosphotransferase [unclassified Arthrobacter]
MDLQKVWASPDWRDQVQQWITQVLDSCNLSQTGPLEPARIRFWSTQLTVPTNHGRLWFKANNPGQFTEAALVACMSELVPDHVVTPLAIEPAKGWMLTPDHGKTLASLKSTDYQLWVRVVMDFADLQKQLIPHKMPLAAAGLVSMDPAIAGNFASNQLLLHTGLPPEHPLHLSPQAADGVYLSIPALEEAAAAVLASGVPLSLEHNDLHSGNAFIPGTTTAPLRFFDFGDSYWAHPFSSLYVPLTVMQEQWETTVDDARIRCVISAYLECWTDYAPLAELRLAVEPALQLARLHRYGSWLRLLIHADDSAMSEYGPHALEYLRTLTDPVLR